MTQQPGRRSLDELRAKVMELEKALTKPRLTKQEKAELRVYLASALSNLAQAEQALMSQRQSS